jgi:uncharacterized protein YjaG (DUF416 family)
VDEHHYLQRVAAHRAWLESAVPHLSRGPQIAFAASNAERLFPLYAAFAKDERRDAGSTLMREGLDVVWDYAVGASLSSDALRDMTSRMDELIPHTEDCRTLLCYAASSAGAAVATALECCAESDSKAVAATGVLVIDVLDSAPNGEQRVYHELAEQTADIESLREADPFDPEFVRTLRKSAKRRGLSPALFQR